MKPYVLSLGAELDLNKIWEYIAQDNLGAADRWIAKLFEAFELLAQSPAIGHKREDLTSLQVLFWPVGAYLILYRTQSIGIEIAAITQGSRDIPALLDHRTQ